MTNSEYILNCISDRDLAYLLKPWRYCKDEPPFVTKIRDAHAHWAESTSNNRGNMAKGIHGKTVIEEDPSIWAWHEWHYPNGEWKKSGRTDSVSWQVWLSEQYDAEDWREEE